ncbi:MAG: methyltransferase domain-containing protein [bacterium]|nr:methyltransferase domain-containing protein [bacterium]
MKKKEYMLEVGEAGKNRLYILNRILNLQSKNFISGYLKKGMKVLEAGCGAGHMTAWLAEQVGKEGKVIAIDSSQKQIKLAKHNIERKNLNNVEFICRDINLLSNNCSIKDFDIVYCRFLMIHLRKPEMLINLFYSLLNDKGIAIFEEPINRDTFTVPESDIWKLLIDAYTKISELNNYNPNYGEIIVSDLRNSKFSNYDIVKYQRILNYKDISEYIIACFSEFKKIYCNSDACTSDEIDFQVNKIESGAYNHLIYSTFHSIFQIAAKK